MLSQQDLKNQLHYNDETGIFTWLTARKGRKSNAGFVEKSNGYLRICIDKKKYYAHRLAWLYIHGEFPKTFIDHKNCIRTDNRLINLRLATFLENAKNTSLSKSNKSGYKGVSYYKRDKNWTAQCKINGITYWLGRYKTKEIAKKIYDNFVVKNNGNFVNVNSLANPSAYPMIGNGHTKSQIA
jgi:hypothetical protein